MDFTGQVLLAPLTKGGNLPFRRLCVQHGARITMSEMAYAYQVVRRRPTELALLRKHADETCFGVQIAASKPADAVSAGLEAVARGASFVDLNCGCPIHDTVKRGMGAQLLKRPAALAAVVAAMVKELPVPVTVKIRLGWSAGDNNSLEVGQAVQEAGAVALCVHGRSREQRYTKAADWDAIGAVVRALKIPVIGNGDIGTWYEARDLWARAGCAAVMVGRAALMKPWIFKEIEENRGIEPGAEERVGIYFQFSRLLKEHFRDDEKGRKRTMFFLPWHLGFFCRYRPLPEAQYREASRQHPLLQTRMSDPCDLPLLERVLRDPREEVHAAMAAAMWDAGDAGDLIERFLRIGQEHPPVAGEAGEVAVAHG